MFNASALQQPGAYTPAEIEALELENAQLRQALESRVAIEQAKGVLMERFALTPDGAFRLLRQAARNNGEPLHKVAALVTASSTTPASIKKLTGGGR
jgi:AmiR/NasT family two-component response regulator